MRRQERKIDDENIINEIFSKSIICRLAIFDEQYPYIVPMNYGYNNNSLYFHCALKGKKIDLITKNNKVSFEIEQSHEIVKSDISCKWTTKYRSIIGFGTIDFITDFNQKKEGLNIIMQQHGKSDNKYTDKSIENVLILKLNINSFTAKKYGD